MRSIMYTVMGSILGVLWIVFAIILPMLPTILLLIFGVIDAVLAYFLLFIPITHFLGLFFMALGAFTIATHHHSDPYTFKFVAYGAIVGFLLIAGLTWVPGYSNNITGHTNFLEFIQPDPCVDSLGLATSAPRAAGRYPDPNLWGQPTRCENYLLWVVFCVYLLLLIQPFVILLAWRAATKVGAVVVTKPQ